MVSMSELLDLLNTTPVIDGQATDGLDRQWLTERNAHVRLEDARRVRDDLQRVIRGQAQPRVLQAYLADVRRIPVIRDGGIDWDLDANWCARLVLAWGEEATTGRLRPCANQECQLFLLDRSRAGTARWCSMSGCGNRMKARRHYRRGRVD